MAEDDPDERRLAELEERLKEARGRERPPPNVGGSGSSLGMALRLSFDIVAAVVVGAGIGWFLDRWLGTTPLLFIVFFFLGAAAGFFNVIRTANRPDGKRKDRSPRT
jgi:ATP synthase protein I